jgi:hypothetical protein
MKLDLGGKMSRLTDQIVLQAADYYRTHLVECSGVSDCTAVDAEVAIDRTIDEMFYVDNKHKKRRNHHLVVRLHKELWPNQPIDEHRGTLIIDRFYANVRDTLGVRLQELLGGTIYEEMQREREKLARELSVHPDRAPALA